MVRKERSGGQNTAIGIALGVAFGAAIGVATGNLAVWLAVGMAFGLESVDHCGIPIFCSRS